MLDIIKSLTDKYSARVDSKTAGTILGFTADEIRILAKYGNLKPLGNPEQNCRKYYTLSDLSTKFDNDEWLKKATSTVYKHWKTKNAKKTSPRSV
jgi:hypothetical protein